MGIMNERHLVKFEFEMILTHRSLLTANCAIISSMEAWWHIYASINSAIISSDNDLTPYHLDQSHFKNGLLAPGRHQAIIWTNTGILLIEPSETNFSEISIGI